MYATKNIQIVTMLASKNRLTRIDFPTVFGSGRRFHSEHFSIVVVLSLPVFKAAVVVPKKVAKRAVDRNRLRRRAYGVLETYTATSYGVIVLYKVGAPAVSRSALQQELEALLAQSLKPR